MSNFTSTNSEGSVASVYDSYGEKLLLAALYGLISFAGVIGNSAVVLAPILSRKPRTTTNVFVINLAVADLLICMSLPITLLAVLSESKEKLLIPPPLCAFQGFLFVVCIGCSMNSIASIAIYRTLITLRTNQSRRKWLFNRRGLAAMVAINWLLPSSASLMPIVSEAGSYEYDTKISTCSINPSSKGFKTFAKLITACYPLQLVVIFASSVFIVFSVRKHIRRVNSIRQQQIAVVGAVMKLNAQPATHGDGQRSAQPIQNRLLTREEEEGSDAYGHEVKPATRAIYTPLIDMDPADPDTMLTAMEEGQRLTQECGQTVTVFTTDQQLYKLAVNVMWAYPERFSQFIPRLGELDNKLWVENLVKPVLLMMIFVRAEREGDWPLHLWAVNEMIPYFFAAGHHNYARYGLYYLRSMERLQGEVLEMFMKRENVMRHKKGLWNGI
ncbi:D(1A) dopamine receptor-like [Patiria miniata]|uniref:G-protein coupled receptors family 1 profile domain-containing protein n=1 Tax=Patiria miniata TaxID=46514 RepID=A0A914AL90_PATMI|nr:D(1A) dopamine receptor-like [Patiria miniata]